MNEPVPFLLYDSRNPEAKSGEGYSEWGIRNRTEDAVVGHRLIEILFERENLADLIGK